MSTLQYYLVAFIGLLGGNFSKSFNVETGSDKLESAFSVFQEAKAKANEALVDLAKESTKVEDDVKLLEKEFKEKMEVHSSKLSELKGHKERGYQFIEKINGILG